MTKRTIILLVSVLTVLVLVLCGCTTFDNFKGAFIDDPEDTTETINIGVYEPMAGADKGGAEPEIRGIELANELYPEVNGKKINLIYADNNSDITAAETAITTLISKNPAVILGSYGNIYSLTAGEYVEKAGIPAITMTNTNPLITRNNSYYFRICYIDATQGRLLANYLHSLGVEKAGVLFPDGDDAAMAMATAFTNALESLVDKDDTIEYYEQYTKGERDFSKHLKELKDTGVHYVLLPGDVPDALRIINQAADMGLDVVFLGDMSWGDRSFRQEFSNSVNPDDIAFVQFFATDGDDSIDVVSDVRQEFLDAYSKKYPDQKEPENAVALGYDAYMLALDAIEKTSANGSTGENIRDLLLSDDYRFEGASGTILFNKSGDPKKTAYICTWTGDKVKALYTIGSNEQ